MIGVAALTALLAAEGLAVYTLGELFASGGGQTVGWWAFVLVSLTAYGMPRLAEAVAPRSRRSEALVAAAGLLLVYAVLRVGFARDLVLWDLSWVGRFVGGAYGSSSEAFHTVIAGVLLAGLWIHGTRRSADGVEFELLPRQVGLELAGVTAIAVLGVFGDRAGEVGRASAAFYAMAVITLACGQLSLSGVSVDDREAGGIIAALVAGTAAAAVAGVALLTLGLGALGPAVGPPLGAAVDAVLVAVVTPFAWIISWLVHLMLGSHVQWPKIEPPAVVTTDNPKPGGPAHQNLLAVWAVYALRAFLLAALAAGVYGVFRWAARVRQRIRTSDPASPESSASGSLRDDLSAAFRAMFRRGSGAGESRTASRAARLYFDVLAASARAGYPRAPARTPSEFAPELAGAFQSPVTDEITRVFEQARYAGRDPSPEELADLERRWRAVR